MPVLDRDGVSVAYDVPGAPGHAAPLLLSHGFGASAGLWPANRESAQAVHVNGVSGLARAARGTLTQRDGAVMASLPQVAVPTLVVVGAEDAPFLAAADAMARRIPGAEKVVLAGAGHAANM